MGKYDKDRHQKELAMRYCVAKGLVPCLEVMVASSSDLSDSTEVLTDLDVLGLEFIADGGFRRTIFDCKTGNKLSPINRAFWAAGVTRYAGCDEAVVVLKNPAVNNHRFSALEMGVDLHDDRSFEDLGRTYDLLFDQDLTYQSSIDRWNKVYDIYTKNQWSAEIFNLGRNVVPLSRTPWSTFRKLVVALRAVKGHVDPAKEAHLVILWDVLAAAFILWSSMGRDIRRFYDPAIARAEFEKLLKYYIWGGKESYIVRRQMKGKAEDGSLPDLDFPAWERLVDFAGLIIAAPQEIFGCVSVCRDLSIRIACGRVLAHDQQISAALTRNKRVRQFVMSMVDYLIAACGLPKDLSARMQAELASS